MTDEAVKLSYPNVDMNVVMSHAMLIAQPESVIVWNASDIVRVNQLDPKSDSTALDVAAAVVFVAAIETNHGEKSRDIALTAINYFRHIEKQLNLKNTAPKDLVEYSLGLLHYSFLNLLGEQMLTHSRES